jgi:hypothetical protein
MRKFGYMTTAALATVALMAGCTKAETVTGTVKDKYIEDFVEYTVVVETVDGTKHHFEIEADDWKSITIGQQFTNTQTDGDD